MQTEYNRDMKCNKCGKIIVTKNDVPLEDVLQIDKVWGYFSKKDGKRHRWNICESCYQNLIEEFAIPVEVADVTEFV